MGGWSGWQDTVGGLSGFRRVGLGYSCIINHVVTPDVFLCTGHAFVS